MPRHTYDLYARKIDGCLRVTYQGGHLEQIEFRLQDQIDLDLVPGTLASIPYLEAALVASRWELKPVKATPTAEKIAAFCAAYEQHMGTKYQVAPAEAGKIKAVEVTADLLTAWFTSKEWWAQTKTLGRYVRYIAELRESVHARPSRFPDYYDAQLVARMKPSDLQEYWAHLRSLGLKPVKLNGRTTTWKKQEERT